MRTSTQMIADGYLATTNRGTHRPSRRDFQDSIDLGRKLYLGWTGMDRNIYGTKWVVTQFDGVAEIDNTAGVGVLTDA